jgi:very-short-patch-repair endonuclease
MHRDNVPAAKRLRSAATRSEAILWDRLRSRRFHGLKVRRQHPIGRFVIDFYCEDLRLAIEVDGSVHHDSGVAANDAERERLLRERGIWFVRVDAKSTEAEVQSVLAEIERACGFV